MFGPQLFKQLWPFFLFKQSEGRFSLYFYILITVKQTVILAIKQLYFNAQLQGFFDIFWHVKLAQTTGCFVKKLNVDFTVIG
jgi:hypothetical protein